jgi:pimeloyl-ACP methyl ester carboxylesterase
MYIVCAIAIAAAAVWTARRSSHWRRDSLTQLESASKVVSTPHGEIEYALIGAGRPILISHGILGGFDQCAVAGELILSPANQAIAVSRFGYLRTPLSNASNARLRSPEDQADAFAALLDKLEIASAPIIGISGGGPAALQFALRHPHRCPALILISAVTHRMRRPLRAIILPHFRALLVSDAASWFANALYWRWPSIVLLRALSREERKSRPAAAEKRDAIRLMATSVPIRPRWPGLENDATFLMSMEAYPLETLRIPTLILHGTRDSIVPFSQAEYAAGKIPNAKFIPLEGGGHFAAFLRPEKTRRIIADFLDFSANEHSGEKPAKPKT